VSEESSGTTGERLHIRALFCSVITREVSYCIARSRNIVEPYTLPSGLHNEGAEKMSAKIQANIDRLDDGKVDAIVLGFGLCNNGTVGLRVRRSLLVVPRAHDCITFLLGSKERYREIFNAEPGTYYFSPGWLESPPDHYVSGAEQLTQMGMRGLNYEALVEKYGEENARYLMETLEMGTGHYTRYAWISTELGEFPEYMEQIRKKAEEDGKRFEALRGSVSLIQRALDGNWNNEDFAVCQPGQQLVARHSGSILDVEPAKE